MSHALRAACDAVLVGVGTVITDDPQLTVRMVPGASPLRVVLDSTLRLPLDAKILEAGAATTVLTTERSAVDRRQALTDRHVGGGAAAGRTPSRCRCRPRRSGAGGVETLLVEGGARVITSLLAAGVVDRLIVGVAPTIIGQGTEAVARWASHPWPTG